MNDLHYINKAAELAKESQQSLPCACILVDKEGDEVAAAFNSQRADNLVASHAEMKAIAQANKAVGRDLSGLTAYCSCEPCTMCLTALIFAEVDRVVFSDRMNDLLKESEKIDIDCFEFIKSFPHKIELEQLKVKD